MYHLCQSRREAVKVQRSWDKNEQDVGYEDQNNASGDIASPIRHVWQTPKGVCGGGLWW